MREDPKSATPIQDFLEALFPTGRTFLDQAMCRRLPRENAMPFVPMSSSHTKIKKGNRVLTKEETSALAICKKCPVKPECLIDHLESPAAEVTGVIVGGLTAADRRKVKQAINKDRLNEKTVEHLLSRWASSSERTRFLSLVPSMQARKRARIRGIKRKSNQDEDESV